MINQRISLYFIHQFRCIIVSHYDLLVTFICSRIIISIKWTQAEINLWSITTIQVNIKLHKDLEGNNNMGQPMYQLQNQGY